MALCHQSCWSPGWSQYGWPLVAVTCPGSLHIALSSLCVPAWGALWSRQIWTWHDWQCLGDAAPGGKLCSSNFCILFSQFINSGTFLQFFHIFKYFQKTNKQCPWIMTTSIKLNFEYVILTLQQLEFNIPENCLPRKTWGGTQSSLRSQSIMTSWVCLPWSVSYWIHWCMSPDISLI